jgi:hypothetical protein
MKIRCFALFEEGVDSVSINVNGVDVVFTHETVQQDIELSEVLTDTQVSDTVTTPAQ